MCVLAYHVPFQGAPLHISTCLTGLLQCAVVAVAAPERPTILVTEKLGEPGAAPFYRLGASLTTTRATDSR